MADPVFVAPIGQTTLRVGDVVLSDESDQPKWRISDDVHDVTLGRSRLIEGDLVLAVSPGEWIVVGDRPSGESVDLTHVRAMLRVSGPNARNLLTHVCALDLGDLMTPDQAAARTLVSGVATELVRQDVDDQPSYLLLLSRSFARSVWERLVEIAERL